MTTDTTTATVYTAAVRTMGDASFTWNVSLRDIYGTTEDGRTFFATDSTVGEEWVTLFVPESDPRHVGMWADSDSGDADLRNLPDEWRGESPLHGWHVRRDALETLEPLSATPVDSTPDATPDVSPVPEFVDTTFGEIPVGTEWANVGLWDSAHWVKVDEEHYCMLNGGAYVNSMRPDYPVTIRNSERVHVHTVRLDREEELSRLRETVANLEESARRERAEFERWKENAQEVATQYANDNGLCSEFDRCMEAIGLEGRQREYDVTVSVTYSFSVTVPRGEDVEEYVRDNGGPEAFDSYPDVDYDYEES